MEELKCVTLETGLLTPAPSCPFGFRYPEKNVICIKYGLPQIKYHL